MYDPIILDYGESVRHRCPQGPQSGPGRRPTRWRNSFLATAQLHSAWLFGGQHYSSFVGRARRASDVSPKP